jgi:hypothetical protein
MSWQPLKDCSSLGKYSRSKSRATASTVTRQHNRQPMEKPTMQINYTVHLFNLAGEILGSMTIPASVRLLDLESLRALGAVRLKVAA